MASPVYQKTELGRQALKDRSAGLTPKHRSAFILFDGSRSLSDVLAATVGLGVTRNDLELMVQQGFLELAPNQGAAPAQQRTAPVTSVAQGAVVPVPSPLGGVAASATSMTESQERYQSAYPIAAALTSSLGLRGFRLNLAVEGASNVEQLRALLPKIREAVGPEKCRALEFVLGN